MVQRGEHPAHQDDDKGDERRNGHRPEAILGDHLVLDFFFRQADQEGGRKRHEPDGHRDKAAVFVDRGEQPGLVEETIEDPLEFHQKRNQQEKPPANLLAGVRHEDVFCFHSPYMLICS